MWLFPAELSHCFVIPDWVKDAGGALHGIQHPPLALLFNYTCLTLVSSRDGGSYQGEARKRAQLVS